MTKHRLIACLLWNNGVLVQSMRFTHTNAVGNAYTAVDFFNTWAVDEIVLLDVTRAPDEQDFFHAQLKELSKRCFIPLAAGGWVDTVADMRRLLQEGADKVVVNTEAFKHPSLVTDGARQFGNQCMVVSIDVKKNSAGAYEVSIDRGRTPTGVHPVAHAQRMEAAGAGEIFLTSIDEDGQRSGYDCALVRQVSDAVGIPVIASGGVGEWQHLVDGIQNGGADAVCAANIFHYFEQSTKQAKEFMKQSGIDVREPEFYTVAMPRKIQYRV